MPPKQSQTTWVCAYLQKWVFFCHCQRIIVISIHYLTWFTVPLCSAPCSSLRKRILGHWVARKRPNHTVGSIHGHVGTSKHQVDSWPSLPVCIHETFIYVSPALISDSHEGTEFVTQTPPCNLFIGRFIAPPWFFVDSLSLSVLDVFHQTGSERLLGPYVHNMAPATGNDRVCTVFLDGCFDVLNLFGKMLRLKRQIHNFLLLLLLTQASSDSMQLPSEACRRNSNTLK